MTDKITDEMIMALADGELAGPEAERVEAAIAANPELFAQFEAYKASRQVLSAAFGPLLDRPVPDAMSQLVLGRPDDGGGVVSIDSARARRKPFPRFDFLPQAAAAAVLLSAAALSGYQVGQNEPSAGAILLAGLVPQNSPLQDALSATPAGASVDIGQEQFLAIATYQTSGGQVCREFELSRAGTGSVGLACRTQGGWQIEVAVLNLNGGTSDQFLPVSADAFELVGAALDAKGTFEGLDAEQEACVLAMRDCSAPR